VANTGHSLEIQGFPINYGKWLTSISVLWNDEAVGSNVCQLSLISESNTKFANLENPSQLWPRVLFMFKPYFFASGNTV
jgi:hypothetical protein